MAERYIEIDEGGFVDVETFSAPRSSHCSAAIQIAEHVVSQWNLHGRFRVTDEDRALWGGDEPDEVVMARSIIERHGRKTWDSVKEWMNDPCGHGTGGWNVRRFSLLSKVGGKDYIDVTPNEIVNVLIKRIAVSEYRVVTYDGLCLLSNGKDRV